VQRAYRLERIPRQQSVIRLNQQALECGIKPALVIFALYGVLERSRGCHVSVNELNVYRAATLNYTIPHIRIGFGIDMSGHPIDETYVPANVTEQSIGALNLTEVSFMKVSEIDGSIENIYCNSRDQSLHKVCEVPFWRDDYSTHKIRRALRAMYCEHRIAELLQAFDVNTRTVVIVLSADIMLNKPLQQEDILAASCSPGKVFLTQNNDGSDGYTDGFYVGHLAAIRATLSTFDLLPLHFRSGLREQPYEFLLKATCIHWNITRAVLRGFGSFLKDFVKIRANGKIFGNLPCASKDMMDMEVCPQLKHSKCSHI